MNDPSFHVVPVVLSRFEHHEQLESADGEAAEVVAALAGLGGVEVGWSTAASERTEASVKRRLLQWSSLPAPSSSFVFWFGHGASDDDNAWLATAETPGDILRNGLKPGTVADYVRAEWDRRKSHDQAGWAMVVIEACGAATFVTQLAGELLGKAHDSPRHLALFGIGGSGTSYLGTFKQILSDTLGSYTDNDETVMLRDLLWRLEDRIPVDEGTSVVVRIPDVRLPRRRLVPATVAAPMDVYTELREFLATLPEDQRGHFVPKAQGAEHGEPAWYFTGRHVERQRLADWLREQDNGMLLVTGPAGSGKSALLGESLTQSNQELRQLLVRAGQEIARSAERPPDGSFDAAVHLTGLTTTDVIHRIAAASGAGVPPGERDADWLAARLGERTERFTILADGLDEAQEPAAIAQSVLRPIARIPGVRVVVGSRTSTHEGPDEPAPDDRDLLDALAPEAQVVHLERDPAAVDTYVRRRLTAAGVSEIAAGKVAELIRAHERQFLYARLAVHEILADRTLLTPGRSADLVVLLGYDHRELFGLAVNRLGRRSPAFGALLEALAHAQGRGIPRVDQIWATIATAIAGRLRISETDIDALLDLAAPYIMLDAEHGQSVYRLTHRTFQEYFAARQETRWNRHGVADALLDLIRTRPNPYLVHHLARHVAAAGSWVELATVPEVLDILDPASVAEAALTTSGGRPNLPPPIVATIAARHLLAETPPAERAAVRAVRLSRHSGADDREIDESQQHRRGGWRVAWARPAELGAPVVVLTGHTDKVNSLAPVPLPNGRVLLASASDDATVRLWDPITGKQVTEPLCHPDKVVALAAIPVSSGRTLLAAADRGGVQLWDPSNGRPAGERLDTIWATALAVVQQDDGQGLLAVADADGVRMWMPLGWRSVGVSLEERASHMLVVPMPDGRTLLATSASHWKEVRLWDMATGEQIDTWSPGFKFGVSALRPLYGNAGVLAQGRGDTSEESVRAWSPTGDFPPHELLQLNFGAAEGTLATAQTVDGRVVLAVADVHANLFAWDLSSGEHLGRTSTDHQGWVTSVIVFSSEGGRVWLASGGEDATVRLQAMDLGWPVGGTGLAGSHLEVAESTGDQLILSASGPDLHFWRPVTGQLVDAINSPEPIVDLATIRVPGEHDVIATAHYGGAIRWWDLAARTLIDETPEAHDGELVALTTIRGLDGRELIASGGVDKYVRLWDATTRAEVFEPLTNDYAWVMHLTAVPLRDRRSLLAFGDYGGRMRLFEVGDELREIGEPLQGHDGYEIHALAAALLDDGTSLLASSGRDGNVWLWDPLAGRKLGELVGHRHTVECLTTVRTAAEGLLLASGSDDGTVRLWDPLTQRLVRTLRLGFRVRALKAIGSRLAVGSAEGLFMLEL